MYFTGSHAVSSSRAMAYREADVFLLCYKITEPSSLFNALNHWCPEMRAVAPSTPIILVGCQSDLRQNREILFNLSKQGRAPISPEQALTFSQQINALMYVETSAKTSTRAAISAFEVAGLASMGKLSKPRSPRLVNHLLPLDDSCQTSEFSKDFLCRFFTKLRVCLHFCSLTNQNRATCFLIGSIVNNYKNAGKNNNNPSFLTNI